MRIKRLFVMFLVIILALETGMCALHICCGCTDEDCLICFCIRTVRVCAVCPAVIWCIRMCLSRKRKTYIHRVISDARDMTLFGLKTALLD